MTELFEIGVSLALSDSVSSELAKVQKEVLSLSSLLSTGGVTPERLLAVAAAPSAPAKPGQTNKRAASAEEPFELLSPTIEQYLEFPQWPTRPEWQPQPQQPPPRDPGFDSAHAVTPVRKSTSPELGQLYDPGRAPDAPQARSIAIPTQYNFVVQRPSEPRQSAPLAQNRPPPSMHGDQAAPIATPLQHAVFVDGTHEPHTREVPAPVSLALSAAAAAQSPPPRNVSTSKPKLRSDPGLPAQRSMAPLKADRSLEANLSTGRRSRAVEDALDKSVANPSMSATPQRLADRTDPPVQSSNTQQIQGDVYLDGALVGRWLSRTMTRDAERASAGRTAFDVRRGRLLPGPTVG